MKSIELKARAKINLSLDVTGKRADGYHDVKMIMQSVDLHDRVYIEIAGEDIEIECNSPWVPADSENIAFKAANLLKKRFGLTAGVKIRIDKRIPVAAGLAGGSSDAAAVLKGMNTLLSLELSQSELMSLGKELGADVPYCIRGGTMLAEGVGELLTPLDRLQRVDVLIVKPHIGVSTAWVYKNLQLDNIKSRPDTELLINAIKHNRLDILASNMRNVLESVTEQKYSVVSEVKRKLLEYGAAGSMMSGSGPSVFGLFKDRQSAASAEEKLKSGKLDCYLTATTNEEI